MRKFIEVSEETMNALLQGRCVKGSIRLTERGVVFRAYNIQRRKRLSDIMLYRSANGWLKESTQRLKMWVSVPKDLSVSRCAEVLERESGEMTDYLVENADYLERDIIRFL
jgi:hypothetical protein